MFTWDIKTRYKENRPAKSHGFAVRPIVLKQVSLSHGPFPKSHGKFKNWKKSKDLFPTSSSATLP